MAQQPIYNISFPVSVKYASPEKPLHNVIGSSFNHRAWNSHYTSDVYDLFSKCGLGIIRAMVNPSMSEMTERNIEILGLTDQIAYNSPLEKVLEKAIELATYYDGNEHKYNGDIIKCRVDYCALQNEPDLYYRGDKNEAQLFFERTKAVYKVVKRIRPDIKVVIGSFANLKNKLLEDLLLIRDEEGKAFWDYGDIIDFHIYSSNYTNIVQQLTAFKDYCKKSYSNFEYSHLKDKPLWITEFGTPQFTSANAETERHILLPKQILVYLSFGIEKVFLYQLMSYNMFTVTSADCYHGIISPDFEKCAYAGFTYNDTKKSSISSDGLLDKTYIFPNHGRPYLTLSRLNKESIMKKGISFCGKGFTLKRLYIGTMKNVNDFPTIRNLWEGKVVMDGKNFVSIPADNFNNNDFNNYLVAEIDNLTMNDVAVSSYKYTNSYYSIKYLASLLANIEDSPNIVVKDGITVVRWKTTSGIYNYAIWSESPRRLSISVSNDAECYDVKGNLLKKIPIVIDTSPVYITNSTHFQFD